MPYCSRWTVDIPRCAFPTWVFGRPDELLLDSGPIFINAERPETHSLSLHDFREWSKRLAAGLQCAGLQVLALFSAALISQILIASVARGPRAGILSE